MENKTAANEGEVEGGGNRNVGMGKGGGEADKNGMSNFIFSPTFYFAPPPLY